MLAWFVCLFQLKLFDSFQKIIKKEIYSRRTARFCPNENLYSLKSYATNANMLVLSVSNANMRVLSVSNANMRVLNVSNANMRVLNVSNANMRVLSVSNHDRKTSAFLCAGKNGQKLTKTSTVYFHPYSIDKL